MSGELKMQDLIEILTDKYEKIELPSDAHTELDLGCGNGKFSLELSELNPSSYIIAADIMLGRLRKLAKKAGRRKLKNIRILRTEAAALLGFMLKDNSINRLHILCPDPWPKTKHKGHRLLSSQFMSSIYRVLKPGGVFHFSTDNTAYLPQTVENIKNSGLFGSENKKLIEDVTCIKTAFELKWQEEGLEVHHKAWQVKKN
jgi:tRNA (guanine-N7-)-methyltransferase